jgi:pSer/pThr/pTyr-binding forkhead associated (FHA) protein
MSRAVLVPEEGEESGLSSIELNEGEAVVVGRAPRCEPGQRGAIMQHGGISRQHCLIELRGGSVGVVDLGSENGESL